jgi:hypothetical protein
VDCGGPCRKLCASDFVPPDVSWTATEEVAPGLYNVAAYIINPNPTGAASAVPYHAVLYDAQGGLITEYDGTVSLPPHRNTLAFTGAVSTGKQAPARALFEFTATPDWTLEADPLSALQVSGKVYNEDDSGASLNVTLTNASAEALSRTTVYAVLYDKDGNELGFSKTVLDGIAPGASAIAPFTWPASFGGKVISIEILPVAQQ